MNLRAPSGAPPAARPVTEGSLEAFCRERHRPLVGMLGLYLGDRHLAEELAQDALIRLCSHWDRFDTAEDAQRWLNRVAFNLAKSSFRTAATRRRLLDRYGPTMQQAAHEPDDAAVLAVRAAVRALPERQRTAILLRYFDDRSVAETAAVMDCPEGTVKTLTHKAIAALRRAGLEVDVA